ncbi:MAG: NapC/NirT family cytochrome c [Pseudomonadales bacterium]
MIGERGKWWSRLWRQPRSAWLLGVPVGGFILFLAGAAVLGGINGMLEVTSSNEFCFSCHSHETNIRPEYEASTHFSNRTGVRADCADCHLPHDDWFDLVATKVRVSFDVVPELMGKLDTPEKYEANRREMAESVWRQFRADDSRFCRSCHERDAMSADRQSEAARGAHAVAQEAGRTCIDCHRGIVHALPGAE